MKILCVIALFLFTPFVSNAQEGTVALTTTSVARDARFEIIQTPWNASITFRIDKFRGVIDRLATCSKDDSYGTSKCWKEMVVIDISKPNLPQHARYQIVMNALHKTIFLFDVDNGASWQFGVEATEKWYPFIDCTDKTNNQCLWRPVP